MPPENSYRGIIRPVLPAMSRGGFELRVRHLPEMGRPYRKPACTEDNTSGNISRCDVESIG